MSEFKRDRETIDAATDGPWESDDTGLVTTSYSIYSEDNYQIIAVPPATQTGTSDAEFIARARERWPVALDRIAALESALRKVDEIRHELKVEAMDGDRADINVLVAALKAPCSEVKR
jgi:hypothetical protein